MNKILCFLFGHTQTHEALEIIEMFNPDSLMLFGIRDSDLLHDCGRCFKACE